MAELHFSGHKDQSIDGEAQERERAGPGPEVERRAPDAPKKLPKGAWRAVLKGSLREFKADELTDRAAALTYYEIFALFPALLALVSLLGLTGKSTTDKVLSNIKQFAPGSVRDILTSAVQQLQGNAGVGSLMALVGLMLAIWSVSGYVAAFIRAANVVYDMPEGRPVWKMSSRCSARSSWCSPVAWHAARATRSDWARDVADHLTRTDTEVRALDDLLGSVLDAHLAKVGTWQNDDMRRISAWAAILAIPTMIAGFYGMNFAHMPELDWRYGYPCALVVMALGAGLLYRAFRRNGWL